MMRCGTATTRRRRGCLPSRCSPSPTQRREIDIAVVILVVVCFTILLSALGDARLEFAAVLGIVTHIILLVFDLTQLPLKKKPVVHVDELINQKLIYISIADKYRWCKSQ